MTFWTRLSFFGDADEATELEGNCLNDLGRGLADGDFLVRGRHEFAEEETGELRGFGDDEAPVLVRERR